MQGVLSSEQLQRRFCAATYGAAVRCAVGAESGQRVRYPFPAPGLNCSESKDFQHPAQSLWQVVSGGASQYLEVFSNNSADIRCNSKVMQVLRADSVVLEAGRESLNSMRSLYSCSDRLGCFGGTDNSGTDVLGIKVHGQPSGLAWRCRLCKDRRNWSSWNAGRASGRSGTTYWMNRVQGIRRPVLHHFKSAKHPKAYLDWAQYRHLCWMPTYRAQQRQTGGGIDRTFPWRILVWAVMKMGFAAASMPLALAKLSTLSRSTGSD